MSRLALTENVARQRCLTNCTLYCKMQWIGKHGIFEAIRTPALVSSQLTGCALFQFDSAFIAIEFIISLLNLLILFLKHITIKFIIIIGCLKKGTLSNLN